MNDSLIQSFTSQETAETHRNKEREKNLHEEEQHELKLKGKHTQTENIKRNMFRVNYCYFYDYADHSHEFTAEIKTRDKPVL